MIAIMVAPSGPDWRGISLRNQPGMRPGLSTRVRLVSYVTFFLSEETCTVLQRSSIYAFLQDWLVMFQVAVLRGKKIFC